MLTESNLAEDVALAAAATTHNQFVVTQQKTKDAVLSQQPVSYFTQVCFDKITDELLKNMDKYITKSGKIDEDGVIEYTRNATSIFWVTWITLVKVKRGFTTKAFKEPTKPKTESTPPNTNLHELKNRFFKK